MNGFHLFLPGAIKPLANTIKTSRQGIGGKAFFRAGIYPACSEHGAMLRVAKQQLWRCAECNIGFEVL